MCSLVINFFCNILLSPPVEDFRKSVHEVMNLTFKKIGDLFSWTTLYRPIGLSEFLARDSMLSALYAIARPSVRLSVCPSVRPSVRLSHGWISQKRLKLGSCDFDHTVALSLLFLQDKFHPEIRTGSPRAGASNKGG